MSLPSGREGTRKTLVLMRRLVREGKKSPRVRQTAVELTRNLRQKDWRGEVVALHNFVRDRIRYVRDIKGVETLHTPDRVLENEQGDCDDKSLLLAALLESIGHPTRFIAVGFQPGKFSHVLVETKIGDKWIALETTENVPAGWRPPNIASTMIVHN